MSKKKISKVNDYEPLDDGSILTQGILNGMRLTGKVTMTEPEGTYIYYFDQVMVNENEVHIDLTKKIGNTARIVQLFMHKDSIEKLATSYEMLPYFNQPTLAKASTKKSKNMKFLPAHKNAKKRIQVHKEKRSYDYSIMLNRHFDKKIKEMGAVDYKILIAEWTNKEGITINTCVGSSLRWTIECLCQHFAEYNVHIDDAIALFRGIIEMGQ